MNLQNDDSEFRRVRVFKGTPHDCENYRKDSATFYQQLIDQIGTKMCGDKNAIPCVGDNQNGYITTHCRNLGRNNFVFDSCKR